jgi:hypothetical protein
MQRRKTPHVESSRNVELTDLVTTRKQINGVKVLSDIQQYLPIAELRPVELRTPLETMIEGKEIWKEKFVNQT